MSLGPGSIGFFPIAVLVSIIMSTSVAYGETISLYLEAGSYKIVRDERGFDRIEMEGFRTQGSPGSPMLPAKLSNILLPPDVV